MKLRIRLTILILSVPLCLWTIYSCSSEAGGSLEASDRSEIRSIEQAYTQSWLNDDTVGVMDLLDQDAIIMPSGIHPIAGKAEIRKFWWPDDGSVTVITEYVTDIEEIAGAGSLAYVRGTGHLEFVYEKDGEKSEHTGDNMFLMIVRKNEVGEWKIYRRMWGGFNPD